MNNSELPRIFAFDTEMKAKKKRKLENIEKLKLLRIKLNENELENLLII